MRPRTLDRSVLLAALVAALLCAALLPSVPPAVADEATVTDRLSGPDRFATAVAVAQRAFPAPGDAATVYLGRADAFPDALAGGTLTDGPILLVPKDGPAPQIVIDEIARLVPGEVVALGGTAAVADETLASAAGGLATGRLSGPDRFATAVAISQRGFPAPGDAATAYVARADSFPDALAGGALTDGPILLVPRDGPAPQIVIDEIARLAPGEVIALGGTAAVAGVTLASAAGGLAMGRLSGPDRFATAVAVAGRAFPGTAPVVYLARADSFPDALAGGALVDGPILLVPSCGELPVPVVEALVRLAPREVIALGGTAAVCDELLTAAGLAAGTPPPAPTPTPSGSPSATASPDPSASPSGSATASPSASPTGSATASPSASPSPTVPPTTERLAVTIDGGPPVTAADSGAGDMSAEGRYVAFVSEASDLVRGDANATEDVYVRDMETGRIERVSLAKDGGDPDRFSDSPSISDDGSLVAFRSYATNLVDGATSGRAGIFVRDLEARSTVRVDVNQDGEGADAESFFPVISGDGSTVAFASQAANLVNGGTPEADVYVHDLEKGTTQLVSVAEGGGAANSSSNFPTISRDGGRIAFTSAASDLVTGDGNGTQDVFVRDLDAGTTERVSVSDDEAEATSSSVSPSISSDGTVVAFGSFASNLVGGDTNDVGDIFVRDLDATTTERVSVSSDGAEGDGGSSAPRINGDGTVVAFSSAASDLVSGDGNDARDVFVRDLDAGTTERASVAAAGGGDSTGVSIPTSIDDSGQLVALRSDAADLVTGDVPESEDVFVRDLGAATTERVSVTDEGRHPTYPATTVWPSVSDDGRVVAFLSDARNLVAGEDSNQFDVFVRDVVSGTTSLVSVAADGGPAEGSSYSLSLSGDGRFVAFDSDSSNLVTDDENGFADVFVRDLDEGTTRRVSVTAAGGDPDGQSTQPSISGDGTMVAFSSTATDLLDGDGNGQRDVFVRNVAAGTTRRVSVSSAGAEGDGRSNEPAISADGRRVAFESRATTLVPGDGDGDTDVFVHRLDGATTERVSVTAGGGDPTGRSEKPAISVTGRYVAFESSAEDLVAGDANGHTDVFLRDLTAGTTQRVSVATGGGAPDDDSELPSISGDGTVIAFQSRATNLVTGDGNGVRDVFVRDLGAGATERLSVALDGGEADGPSYGPSISADARFVGFESGAQNLVAGDERFSDDAFLRGPR